LIEFDLLGLGGRILSGLLLIPFVGWGIYTLRLRFRYHEDIHLGVEAITLGAVAIFYAIEIYLLREYMGYRHVFYIFAVLGLVVSGAALYGPMGSSLLSQLVVDTIAPGERSKTREPRFAPAEALERENDYEGALREYMVIARIFPQEPAVHVRIADAYMMLSRPEEAVRWFERALRCIASPEKSLQITNRLCEIYGRQLGRPDEVARLLSAYLDRYPEAEYAVSVRERLRRLETSV